MANFGERLRLLREQRELSQEALGKKFHLSQSIIAHYEAGRKQPSQDILQRLADFFGVSVDYLLGRTPLASFVSLNPEDLKKLEHYKKTLDETVLQIKEIMEKYSANRP